MDEKPNDDPEYETWIRSKLDETEEIRSWRARNEYAQRIPVSNPEARLVREVLARHQRELTELAQEIAQDRGIDTTRYTLQSRPTGIAWELSPPPAHVIDLEAMARQRNENGSP